MYSTILSGTVLGMESCLVQVEVDLSAGLPCFIMVGHLSGEVRESAERVRIALKNNGIHLPAMHIAVNLSPADVRKEGTGFDLPVALAVLTAMERLTEKETEGMMILGELGLNGEIRKVRGILPMVGEGLRAGITRFLVPLENLQEARLIGKGRIAGIGSLTEAVEYLKMSEAEQKEWENKSIRELMTEKQDDLLQGNETEMDFSEVSGQESGKRAAMIAAAGFHHLLFCGPPGCGKTMLARRIPTILPPLSEEERLEVASVYSIAGLLDGTRASSRRRPFVSPHHSLTPQALAGGGVRPSPGVVSLAHRGVLFLDELPEFSRKTLDLLRQPLEDRKIQITRTRGNVTYPTEFMLVGAMNPCPCGYFPDRNRCRCTPYEIHQYISHLSGPILNRIDLQVRLKETEFSVLRDLENRKRGESSEGMKNMVMEARSRQDFRYRDTGIRFNAQLTAGNICSFCKLGRKEEQVLEQIYTSMKLGARACHKLLKVARTIADLAGSEIVRKEDLLEAACYCQGQE